jgi:hypothetical protein
MRASDVVLNCALLSLLAATSVEARPMSRPNTVEAMIERLIATPAATQAAVENSLGLPLTLKNEVSGWRHYEAGGSSPLIARVDYRLPISAAAQRGGALLIVELADCHALGAVRTRFGPLDFGPLPSPHAVDATGYLVRHLGWGRISFGYGARTPECLSSVVVELAKPASDGDRVK